VVHTKLPCNDVLHSLVLFIDHEIEDQTEIQKIEIHFQECPPCMEQMEHEKSVISKLKSLLSGSCNEVAPDALQEKIAQQTAALAQEMQSQFLEWALHSQPKSPLNLVERNSQ